MKRCTRRPEKEEENKKEEEEKHNRGQTLIVTLDFTNLHHLHTHTHTHQYAVTKASQIGNSFSQFRFNDHRGNVNVSDGAGASPRSLPASILATGMERGQENV